MLIQAENKLGPGLGTGLGLGPGLMTLNLCFGRRPKLRPFFICFNLLVGIRKACVQNFIILAPVVFEIAMRKTLHICL